MPADEVLKLGERWARAELSSDAQDLNAILTDDFAAVGPLGFVLNKQAYIKARESGDLRNRAFTWNEVALREYGDVAVAVGVQVQTTTYRGQDASGRFRVTQIARKRSGRWLIAGLHYSPTATPPGRSVPIEPVSGKGTAEARSDEHDGVVVDPAHHRVLFENEFVRVIESAIPVGERTMLHTHHHQRVMIPMSGSSFVRREARGRVIESTRLRMVWPTRRA